MRPVRRPKRPTGALRVLVVSHEASRTGAPRVAVEVLRALRLAGHEAHCVVRWPGPMTDDLRREARGLRLEPLRRLRVLAQRSGWYRSAAFVATVGATLSVMRNRPDVVYVNSLVALPYLRPCRRLGIPAVLHIHEVQPYVGQLVQRFSTSAPLIGGGVAVLACSKASRASLQQAMPDQVLDVTVIPSVPDADRLRRLAGAPVPSADQITIGLCGAVNPGKGSDLWSTAASHLASRGIRARLVWLGGLRPVAALDGDPTEYLPAVANPYPWLQAFDILVVASRTEAFGLVVLEAMTLGTPVVAFDVGGLSEPLGDTGVLVTPEDPKALADAVESLISDPERRRRLAQAGQARARDMYGIEEFRSQIVGVVEGLLSSTRS